MKLSHRQTVEREGVLKRGLDYSFRVFLALRIGTLAWMLLLSLMGGRTIHEPDVLCPSAALAGVSREPGPVLSPWLRWDTICYLLIAETGYESHAGLTVWPPLYPLLIRAVSWAIPSPLLAALILSSLAAWLAFFLLYVLLSESHGESTARNTLFLYAVYPLGFFLVAGYTESLFLAMAAGTFLLARRRAWPAAGLAAALATLTRNQGLVLSPVLLLEGLSQARQERVFRAREAFGILLAASLPVLAFTGFTLYVRYGLNGDWPWQTLATLWGQYAGFPGAGILGNAARLLALPASQDLYWLPTTLLDLLLAILIPVVLILRRGSNRPASLLFAWLILLLSLLKLAPDHTLVSFSRYMIAAFPFFAALSPLLENRSVRLAVFGTGVALQALFLAMFYIWSWAG